MSTTGIIVIALLVLSPVLWFISGFVFKLLWGFAPMLISLGISGYLLWQNGLDWLLAVPVGITLGIAFTWLWQRAKLFLAVDRWVETHVFFDK